MQRVGLIIPRQLRVGQRDVLITKPVTLSFKSIFEPQTPSTFRLLIKARSIGGPSKAVIGFSVGGKPQLRKKLTLGRSMHRFEFDITDEAENYSPLRVHIKPQRGRTIHLKAGIFEAPDPRYVYQLSHPFTSALDDSKAAEIKIAEFDNPIYASSSDADNAASSILNRIHSSGASTEDLGDVYDVSDGTSIRRSLRRQRRPVPPDWLPSDGLA